MSQPFSSGKKEKHRVYIPAEWAEPGEGGGAPKLAGGYEADLTTGEEAPRSFNRADQRYELDELELQSRRNARADEEYPATVILQAEQGKVLLKGPGKNTYRLHPDSTFCNCPDYWRLQQSGKTGVTCKHIVMMETALFEVGGYDDLPWSAWKVAEWLGVAISTAEGYFEDGKLPGTKVNDVWVLSSEPEGMTAVIERAAHLSDLPLPLDIPGVSVVE